MRAAVLAIALASSTALASPVVVEQRTRVFDFDDDVIGDVDIPIALDLDPGDVDLLRSPPTNPRIIDIEQMHRRDCALDRVHGGQCVLRGFDEPLEPRLDPIDYARERVEHNRIDALDRIIDTTDAL